jgi:hypothetical protein
MSRQKRRVLKAEKIQNSESAENAELWNQKEREKSGTERTNRNLEPEKTEKSR